MTSQPLPQTETTSTFGQLAFDDTLRGDLVFTDGDDTGTVWHQELLRMSATDDGVLLTITSGGDHIVIPWNHLADLAKGIVMLINAQRTR
jgi:propanediol dehydratase large subunit